MVCREGNWSIEHKNFSDSTINLYTDFFCALNNCQRDHDIISVTGLTSFFSTIQICKCRGYLINENKCLKSSNI